MSKKLTILHTESSCGWGGQEIRILTEASGMRRRGHRVILLADPKSRILAQAPAYGLEAVGLPIEKKRIPSFLAMRHWLSRNAEDIDVINTHSSTDAWLVALARASLSNMPPVIRTRHVSTSINNSPLTRWLYLQGTRHIVTTGERLRMQLYRENSYPLERMTSIRTGIDLARYTPSETASARLAAGIADRPTIGILATLRSWKGHSLLLSAWQALSKSFPEWQLLIVGDGPQRENLEQQASHLGLTASVIFAGNQDNAEQWLPCMDIFSLPSYGNEGVPQGIMQAMACGLPVVSTMIGAIDEAVQHGKTGFLIPPRDVPALITNLQTLMDDADLRKKMADAGRSWAHEHFGEERMLDRMESVFFSVRAN